MAVCLNTSTVINIKIFTNSNQQTQSYKFTSHIAAFLSVALITEMLEICIHTSYDQNVQLILKSYLPVVHGTPLIVKGKCVKFSSHSFEKHKIKLLRDIVCYTIQWKKNIVSKNIWNKGNNKITELPAILQRESQNSKVYKQTKSINNRKTVKECVLGCFPYEDLLIAWPMKRHYLYWCH